MKSSKKIKKAKQSDAFWSIKNYQKLSSYHSKDIVQGLFCKLLTQKSKIEDFLHFSNSELNDRKYIFLLLDEIDGSSFETILKNMKSEIVNTFLQPEKIVRCKNYFLKNSDCSNYWDNFLNLKFSPIEDESVPDYPSDSPQMIIRTVATELKSKIFASSEDLSPVPQLSPFLPTNLETIYQVFSEFILTPLELEKNIFPFENEGYLNTANLKLEMKAIFALDCEMVKTTEGIELAQISLIDFNFKTVYQKFVKPESEIVDYITHFSGITEETYVINAYCSLKEVQNDLMQFIGPDTILVGHGLENDLHALRLVHERCIDTSILFQKSPPYKSSLKSLAYENFKAIIQQGEHDPNEDAKTALALARYKIEVLNKFKPENKNGENSSVEFLNLAHKKMGVTLVDFEYNVRRLLQSDVFYEVVTRTDEVLKNIVKSVQRKVGHARYCQLVFGRFLLNQNHDFEAKVQELRTFLEIVQQIQKEEKVSICLATSSFLKLNSESSFGYDVVLLS